MPGSLPATTSRKRLRNVQGATMKKAKYIASIVCSILATYVMSFIFISNGSHCTWAAVMFLGDRHKNAGIVCAGCHQENPPSKPAPTATCFQCHGDYPKLAERTQKLPENPHESHLGDLDCDKCHHAHKSSTDYCAECHSFGFKAP